MDKTTIQKLAKLSRLALTEGEEERLTEDLGAILQWVEQLQAVDTSHVEPMTSGRGLSLRLRTDEITDRNCAEDILFNAPRRLDQFFVVPKVVE